MMGLLGTLIMVYLRLDIGRGEPGRDVRLYVHLLFSVYLGWITVAPIANVTALLVSWGWPSYGSAAVNWALLVIGVAAALSLANVWLEGRRGIQPGPGLGPVWHRREAVGRGHGALRGLNRGRRDRGGSSWG